MQGKNPNQTKPKPRKGSATAVPVSGKDKPKAENSVKLEKNGRCLQSGYKSTDTTPGLAPEYTQSGRGQGPAQTCASVSLSHWLSRKHRAIIF